MKLYYIRLVVLDARGTVEFSVAQDKPETNFRVAKKKAFVLMHNNASFRQWCTLIISLADETIVFMSSERNYIENGISEKI